jgi:hypothetical protein
VKIGPMKIEIIRGRSAPPTRTDDWLLVFVLALWFAAMSWLINGCGRFDGCPEGTVEVYQSPPTPFFKQRPTPARP